MTPRQEASWRGIIAVARRVPGGWCLVGGQMVQLWCWEREVEPVRPTDDGDAVLDIRAQPNIMTQFTQALVDSGFEPDGQDWRGHQHRWVNQDHGQIDILLPEGIGGRARRVGVRGGTTLETPGAQNVLHRAEPFEVSLRGQTATIFRPTLQGALIAKAYAYGLVNDPLRQRHLQDFAVLCSMIRISDRVGDGLRRKERNKLFMAYSAAITDPLAVSIDDANGLRRLAAAAAWSA
ncbi:hypothetical protein ACFRFH_12845 [Leifsonia sp. NPDC056824]|uniref:hypothetical protein n=1 Tax=Leifsonia sp. NPDC056824 TaxID=3345953 RepID=UPI0036833AC9